MFRPIEITMFASTMLFPKLFLWILHIYLHVPLSHVKYLQNHRRILLIQVSALQHFHVTGIHKIEGTNGSILLTKAVFVSLSLCRQPSPLLSPST